MTAKWETLEEREGENFRIFSTVWLKRRHPEDGREGNFVVLRSPDWVNIIPVTDEGKIVMIEQYRHGADDLTLEIPGGLIDPGEDSRMAGQRECTEETGYESSSEAEKMAEIQPNPAFLDNICYTYVWRGCKKTSVQKLDEHEDISVKEYTVDEIKKMIKSGKINHSLVLNAFFYYFTNKDNL